MRVSDFKKKVRRTTEKAFEDLFAEVLAERNIYSRHMSDRFSGVPDRYIAGGRWVELKSVRYDRTQMPWYAGMSVEQHRVATDLVNGGDDVFYLALIARGERQYVMRLGYVPWKAKRDLHINIEQEATPYEGKKTLATMIPPEWSGIKL